MTGIANGINNALLAALNMNSHLINSVTDPVSAQDAATKNYVDTVATGLNPKPASAAASTTALTVTYNNGTAGVGATLTNAGAQAALVIDGYTTAVNDVILIKDQASTLQNGLYTVTDIGSGATNWVLTRSVYMDQPTEFKGGYTFVINGTVNAGRSFVETATVTAVGTDAVTFTQFSQSKQLTVTFQSFTSNGTYTPTTGMAYCIVEMVGGGGGGGGCTGGTGGQAAAGAPGGAGGYLRKLFTAAQVGATAAVVVGAAGAAGASGNNAGGDGGDSTFTPSGTGSTLTAHKGTGGAGMAKGAGTATALGGTGGGATNGDFAISGASGSFSSVGAAGAFTNGPPGGNSFFGSGGFGQFFGSGGNPGQNGSGYGSGGSGGVDIATSDRAGGSGDAGIVIVTEFNLV